MNRTWLTLRRALTLLLVAGGALFLGDYLYEGARKAEAEARLAHVQYLRERRAQQEREHEKLMRAAETLYRDCESRGEKGCGDVLERYLNMVYEAQGAASPSRSTGFDVEAALKDAGVPVSDQPASETPLATEEDGEVAMHEAAHAVVSVRLGLPLESTDIIEREEAVGAAGKTIGVSQGFTTLREGTVRPWLEALPDEGARRNLEAFGAQGAAGIVAERYLGSADDHPAIQEDLTAVVIVAGWLGLGKDAAEPPVRRFVAQATARAEEVLMQDGGAAWDRVTEALIERRALSGDDVQHIVSEGGT